MKRISSFFLAVLICIVALLSLNHTQLDAQSRGNKTDSEYYRLAWRALQPQSFIQHQIIPTSDSLASVLIGFSLSYDLLQFKKNDASYDAKILISLDIFKTSEEEAKKIDELEKKEQEDIEKDRKKGRRPNLNILTEKQLEKIEDLIPVETIVFRDTLMVNTYEATTSRSRQFTGNFFTSLEPGIYRYRIELRQNDDPTAQQSRFRTLRIRKDKPVKKSLSMLIGDYSADNKTFLSNNLSGKIPFGKPFNVLLWLPDSLEAKELSVNLKEIGYESMDTTIVKKNLAQLDVENAIILDEVLIDRTVQSSSKNSTVAVKTAGYKSYIYRINGADLPNSRFSLEVYLGSQKENPPLYTTNVSSYWADMPLALFNVDLAIEMLRFIVPESKVKSLIKGNTDDKIAAFERFWKEKDPTPNTDFNELMTEYYRRIDYAFEHYSSPTTPGFENDMGQYYIKLGPPTEKKRTLLGQNQTMVQWFYPQVELVFQSTSGFGDYRLVERKSRS
jgi:GWxTD domain-containing protein